MICYGRSVKTIAEQLFGDKVDMSEEDRVKAAQDVYDSVLRAFPALNQFMIDSQAMAKKLGYVETFLGRRRHIREMQLPEFEFKAMSGYVNPDVDALDITTLDSSTSSDEIPERISKALLKEMSGYKYFGQIVKRTKELAEMKIRVINNKSKIQDASRKCVNCVDAETLILTKKGFKSYKDINVGDAITSFNMKSGKFEDDEILDIIINEESNKMLKWEGAIDAVTTYNHRWPICDLSKGYSFSSTKFIGVASKNKSSSIKLLGVNPKRMRINEIKSTDLKMSEFETDMNWCVRTRNETWIAKRGSTSYVTGNSRIQGGAADLTKMAMLKLESNTRWKEIGGRLINCIHDELVAEVPIENYEEGKQIIADCMCSAANFMPFPISCDVETTLRWYGCEYPCAYPKPEFVATENPEEIKWLQYMMIENEYTLPVYPNEDGSKPMGDATKGINGIRSDELDAAIRDWETNHRINPTYTIEALEEYVYTGLLNKQYML